MTKDPSHPPRPAYFQPVDYEYQRMTLPRGTSRNAAHRALTDAAEQGHWELARLRLYPDGTRKVTLRRRIIRVKSTLSALAPLSR